MMYLITAFMGGLLTKVGDESKGLSEYPLGTLYGLFIALSVYLNPTLSSLVAGITLGNLLMGKVDAAVHWVALLPIGAAVLLWPPDLFILPFFLAAFLDEWFHERSKGILSQRVLCPLAALFFLPVEISYLLAILSFDGGYRLSEWFLNLRQP